MRDAPGGGPAGRGASPAPLASAADAGAADAYAASGFVKDARHLIVDRDPLYTAHFKEILASANVELLRLPTSAHCRSGNQARERSDATNASAAYWATIGGTPHSAADRVFGQDGDHVPVTGAEV